jgi:hypothetical protein
MELKDIHCNYREDERCLKFDSDCILTDFRLVKTKADCSYRKRFTIPIKVDPTPRPKSIIEIKLFWD